MEQGFIKYIVIIAIILAVVFLSQLTYFRGTGKTLISDATNQASAYLAKGSGWITSKIYPKINDEVKSGGDTIKNTITNTVDQQKKVPENILEKTKNYFSNVAGSIMGKENNNCQVPVPQTPPVK